MFFGDRPRGGRRHKVAVETFYDEEKKCWASCAVYVYVGPKALEVKR